MSVLSMITSHSKLTATFAKPNDKQRDSVGATQRTYYPGGLPLAVWIQPASSRTILAYAAKKMTVSHSVFVSENPEVGAGWLMEASDGRKFEVQNTVDHSGVGRVWSLDVAERLNG